MPTDQRYPGKVLLFGEYSILVGSRALAMPYAGFSAHWQREGGGVPEPSLLSFGNYLAEQFTISEIDAAALALDVRGGWRLASDIPLGYGLGSSGAVCAAVFDAYAGTRARQLPAAELKAFFGRMESHFHGSSSGTDPLIIYLRQPVLLAPDGAFTTPGLAPLAGYSFFLLDTRQSRQTGPLVQHFLRRYERDTTFGRSVQQQWIPAVERAIDATLAGDGNVLYRAFRQIRQWQWEHMTDYIPPALHDGWHHPAYLLKLCGAGGGGFMLGLTPDWPATQRALADWRLLRLDA